MQTASSIALKEWAAVCAAIRRGEQVVILRKGGIDEGADGFQPQHNEFWLYPTRFHQDPSAVVAQARVLVDQTRAEQPPHAKLRIGDYCVVTDAFELTSLDDVMALAGLHILSPATIEARFRYRQPGLCAMVVRAFALPEAIELAETPGMAGCQSWVSLPQAVSTAALKPVLSDEAFEKLANVVREARARP